MLLKWPTGNDGLHGHLSVNSQLTIFSLHRYKQRLFIKCMKHPQNKQKLSGALDGHQWRFLKSGLDDFRDGYPLNIDQEIFVSSQCYISSVLFGKTCSTAKVNRKLLTKKQMYFSKEIPLKQIRYAHVDSVEETLTEHPLALYPHLERGMAPEVS